MLHLRGLLDFGLVDVAERIAGGGGKLAGRPSRVAEKATVWRSWGIFATIRSTGSLKPMSSMRSASSRTRMRNFFRLTAPRSITPSRRPGVATMMCALAALVAWAWMPTPP